MQKNTVFNTLFLVGGLLLSTSVYAEKTSSKVVADPDKLREITKAYRNDPSRPNDFIPQGDGTVIDKRTGLQWMRCSFGQNWTGKTCSGKAKEEHWEKAVKQSTDFAGYSDWRLPTIAELETLVYCHDGGGEGRNDKGKNAKGLKACNVQTSSPQIAEQAFPKTERWNYWSSSPNTKQYYKAWNVFFGLGASGYYYQHEYYFLRLVRDGR